MSDNITINIVDNPANVSVGLSSSSDVINVNTFANSAIWGNIIGLLSAQSDLWYELSAKALNADLQGLKTFVEANSAQWDESADIIPTVVNFLSSNLVTVQTLNATSQILSGGVDIGDIFITSAQESQTLTYNPESFKLSIDRGNEVSLSSIPLAAPVQSVNSAVGDVYIGPADYLSTVTVSVFEAGEENVNGEYVYAGVYFGKGEYRKSKDTVIYWDNFNWYINHNYDDLYISETTNADFPWEVETWSVIPGATGPAPSSVVQATGDIFESIIGVRTNPALRGTASTKNVGTGPDDVAAGDHTHVPVEVGLGPEDNAIFQTLSTQSVSTGVINAQVELLSANVPLHDIFITTEEESQTLTYNVTGESLTIDRGNTVSLSSLSYRTITDPTGNLETIQQFANSYNGDIHPGFNVTLYNGRVYTFAGTDKNNSNHYLEVNTNPYMPIYREVALSGSQTEVIDTFYLGNFKTARYNLQIETNFNNEIYYSEINVVGSVQTSTGVASEYGQIFTDQLILGYDVNVSFNHLNFIVLYNTDMTPGRKIIIKGHRTNFYMI